MRFADAFGQQPHRSFWRQRLERSAGGQSVQDFLIDQANLRGFLGAYRVGPIEAPIDPLLSLEDLVVGLLDPRATVDARVLKLLVRLLQSGQLNPALLWLRAARERADAALFWLLQLVPEEERVPAIRSIQELRPRPPRGYRAPRYNYSPARLIRHPASREDLWRRARS